MAMLIHYDKSPNASLEQKMNSLVDSVQRALENTEGTGKDEQEKNFKEIKEQIESLGEQIKEINGTLIFSEAGNRWGVIPIVSDTGATKVGKYVHFHNSDTDTTYAFSLFIGNNGALCTSAGTGIESGGHIILKNTYALIGRNAAGLGYNLALVNASDNIIWGSPSLGGHYSYMLPEKQFKIISGEETIFNSWYDATKGRYVNLPAAYAQTTSGGSTVRVGSTGTLYRYVSSSRRYKEAITTQLNEELNPEKLYNLLVVQYKYREGHLSKTDQRYGKDFIGLLAEDVKMKYPIAANMGEDGFVENYNIDILVPAMLKLIQNQKKQLDKQELRIKALEDKVTKIEAAFV